jgi:thioredoxin-like negative regulator of GroEL
LYVRIGLVELVQSHLAEAIIAFKKARAARTADSADVHAYLAAAYALNGETEQAATELTEVRRKSQEDRFSSISRVRAGLLKEYPREKIRALFEATYIAGLRKAGMPEE